MTEPREPTDQLGIGATDMTDKTDSKEREDVELSRACVKAWDSSGFTSNPMDAVHPMFSAAFELGYRASLEASAGSEPVACADSWTNDQWIDLAQRHANADWDSDTPDGYLNAVKALCNDFAAANHSPPEGMVGGWIALPGTLPEPGVPVLLDIGKKYPIRAMWAAKHTVPAAGDDTDWGEYDEATDQYWCPEGWYEWNEHEDTNWAVSATPRAWATLPPTTPAGSGKGD